MPALVAGKLWVSQNADGRENCTGSERDMPRRDFGSRFSVG
jgi:hypothetical protein